MVAKLHVKRTVANKFIRAALVLAATSVLPSKAAGPGDEVIVVFNTRVPESKGVAEYYASKRGVPANQVFGFALPTDDDISRGDYTEKLEKPLAEKISDAKLWSIRSEFLRGTNKEASRVIWKPVVSKIRYAVLCYGVPYRIKPFDALKEKEAGAIRQELRRNEAAVDTELALLPLIEQNLPITGPWGNPFYGSTNSTWFSPTNGILMVTRLDGPNATIARGLVDKALEAETNGLWGRAYIDIRNIADTNYAIGDNWMRGAAEICRHLGFETVVDTNAGTFPASFPMSQIAFYAGWYDNNVSGPFTREHVEFMPGAFGYHLHSYSAANIRSAKNNWVGPLLAKGVTATMGSVAEPYLGGTPDMAVFAGRFLFQGFTYGEAAYAAQSVLSWQTTIIGDPLYRPMGKPAQQMHEELVAHQSKWLEWSFLRLVNVNLARPVPAMQMMALLENLPLTKQSAVLTEKLADLYASGGKPSSAVEMWERALKLDPSPEQQLRIRLTLADKLAELDRSQEAVEVLGRIPNETPDYPGNPDVYRKLASLARKLGKPEAAASYDDLARSSHSGGK